LQVLAMPLQQINLRLPADLVGRFRVLAKESGRSLNVIAAEALEQRLQALASATGKHPEADPSTDRLDALEQRVTALEARAAAPPTRVTRSTPDRVAPGDPISPDGAITTAELATVLGIRRHTLNARLARLGGAVVGLELPDGWRCVGKVAPPQGGPKRWCWVQSS